ncbi:phospholipid carrier-dependent glycosyltransferase [bacterium]|nr:phospholipid carrier-dependent glycosyltransferase [bacterium]
MPERLATRGAAVATLTAITLLLMLVGLDGTAFRGLYDDVDRALIARNMTDSGDWLVADYLGEPLHTKPPLMYWVAGLLHEATGRRDELPARLASVLGMLVLVLGTAHLGWRMRDLATGVRAGLLLVTMHLFLAMARQPLIDTVMLAGLGVALVALAELLAGPPGRRRWWWLVLAAAVGWGLMAKGPVILPVLALVFGPVVLGRDAVRPSPATLAGMVGVVMALVLPWHVAMVLNAPEYLDVWRTEILGRVSGSDAYHAWTQKPWWFYGPDLVNTLPWLALWLVGLVWAWRRRREDRWRRILLWWAVGGLAFYTVASATKRSYYLLPMYPAFALLAADLWHGHLTASDAAGFPRRAFRVARAITVAIVVALAVAVVATSALGLVPWGWAAGSVAAVLAAGSWWWRGPDRWRGLDALLTVAAVALMAYHAAVVPPLHAHISGKPFYLEARERIAAAPDAPLAVSRVHLTITAFYLETQDFHHLQPQELSGTLPELGGGWLLTRPDVAEGLDGLVPVLVRSWRSPFGRDERSLGLYRIGNGAAADRASMLPSPHRPEDVTDDH